MTKPKYVTQDLRSKSLSYFFKNSLPRALPSPWSHFSKGTPRLVLVSPKKKKKTCDEDLK